MMAGHSVNNIHKHLIKGALAQLCFSGSVFEYYIPLCKCNYRQKGYKSNYCVTQHIAKRQKNQHQNQ